MRYGKEVKSGLVLNEKSPQGDFFDGVKPKLLHFGSGG